ncbi:MAG TPA: class I SAM-dependent methyltransferase [Terracidiphilus sp.]|nr:class I SAM-dependent methyltransferase [Terracidiphilus sp.]
MQKRVGSRHRLPGLTVAGGYTLHPFDEANGVRTSGLIAGRYLKSGHRHDRHATAYFGVAPSVFKALLRRWSQSKPVAPIEEFTFVDLGAGMGRAVLLASEMPFRNVIGVELNPTLARIARRNVRLWQAGRRKHAETSICCRDALAFRFPTGPCLVFLFNPFGAPVVRRLLTHIAASFAERPGHLDLLYVNDEQADMIRIHPGFSLQFRGKVPRSRTDAIADHAIMANQPDGEYASANYEDCSIWRWIGSERNQPHTAKR